MTPPGCTWYTARWPLWPALITWAAAGWAALKLRRQALVSLPVIAAALIMLVQVLLGGEMVLGSRLPVQALQPVHMLLAVLALGLLSAAALAAFLGHANPSLPTRLSLRTSFSRLALAGMAGLFVLMLSGALVTALDAGAACSTWPLCRPETPLARLALAHRVITLAVLALQTALFVRAWRGQRSQPVTLTAATAGFVLLLGQVLLGAVKVTRGFPADLVVLHAAASAALWAVQVITFVGAGALHTQ